MDQQADDVLEDLPISIELLVPVSRMWTVMGSSIKFGAEDSGEVTG